MDVNVYFKTRFVGRSNIVDDSTYPDESRMSPLDSDAASVMFPINEETGNIVDLLTRLMRTENQLERNNILQMLENNSSSSQFANVDDSLKLELLKPRSLQSLDEVAAFRDVVSRAVAQLNAPHEPQPEPQHEPQPEPQPEPTPTAS